MRKLIDYLPANTNENPWAQVCFVFDELTRVKKDRPGKSNYQHSKHFYLRYLSERYDKGGDLGKCEIKELWSKYSFVALCDDLKILIKERKYSSNTIAGHLYMFRNVLRFAIANELIDPVIFCAIPPGEAETDQSKPYDKSTMDLVIKTVHKDFEVRTKGVLSSDYAMTGIGTDPRLQKVLPVNNPWRKHDNQVWYFENVFNCVPFPTLPEFVISHRNFFRFSVRPILRFYEKLGIIPGPYLGIVAVSALLIGTITGLNSSSIFNLEVDCIQKDEKSDFACLRYFKRRSTGSKTLTKDVLTPGNFKELQKIVDLLIRLSCPFRPFIHSHNLDKKLFIFIGKTGFRKLSIRSIGRFSREMEKQYGLDFLVNLRRIRATVINHDLASNRDITKTQEKYGHESGKTTLSYGSKNVLESEAIKEIGLVLSRRFFINITAKTRLFYKTSLAHCEDPFSPPDKSTKVPCTLIHKCLSCQNFRFSIGDLPKVINYYFTIKANRQFQLKQLPNQKDYENTIKYAETILVEHNLQLTSMELNEIIKEAITGNFCIDPLIN